MTDHQQADRGRHEIDRGHSSPRHDGRDENWRRKGLSRFELAAPRHFLLPAILLLLAEEPRHGYGLAQSLNELRVGRVDRPGVYRALAQLERDGLVTSSPEASRAGSGRLAYSLTDDGVHVLRSWMGVIKQERDGLDRVLRRYVATGTVDAVLAEVEGRWHNVTATPWSPVSSTSRPVSSASPLGSDPPACVPVHEPALLQVHWGAGDPVGRNPPTRFSVVPQRSVVLIEARSSVGPITFGALGLTGVIEATIAGHRIDAQSAPRAHLEVDVAQFQSGNSLYDAELLRRIDARRHQKVALELRACTPLGETGRFRLEGTATFHGVTRPLEGTVSVTMTQSHKIVIRGEQTIDIRDFGVASPTVLMLRIYPDVVVKLQIEAESTSLEWDA